MSKNDSEAWILCKDMGSQSGDLDYDTVEVVENEYDWIEDLKAFVWIDSKQYYPPKCLSKLSAIQSFVLPHYRASCWMKTAEVKYGWLRKINVAVLSV